MSNDWTRWSQMVPYNEKGTPVCDGKHLNITVEHAFEISFSFYYMPSHDNWITSPTAILLQNCTTYWLAIVRYYSLVGKSVYGEINIKMPITIYDGDGWDWVLFSDHMEIQFLPKLKRIAKVINKCVYGQSSIWRRKSQSKPRRKHKVSRLHT